MRVFTLLFVLALFSFSVHAQNPIIAKQDFDSPVNLASSSSNPALNSFSSVADGFGIYQRNVSSSIPFDLLDDSNGSFPPDMQGIIGTNKTDAWFGATDTDNSDNPGGAVTASWTFDINNATNLSVEIEMGAMGDFESSDAFEFTYSIDGGAAQPLFSGSTNESGSLTYTLESGTMVSLDDPFVMEGITLTNNLTNFTKSVAGTGSQITITFNGDTDGGGEAFAFDNICIRGQEAVAGGCDELFFSQYTEGSGSNKCLEVYNPTDAAVSLDGVYSILKYSNANTSVTSTINLTGTIAAGDVLVVCNTNQAILPAADVDISTGSIDHNGNDNYTLTKNGTVVDAIGQIGSNITYGSNTTLFRKTSINTGDTNGNDAFNAADEWDFGPDDTGAGFGEHDADGCETAPVCSITSVMIDGPECDGDDSFFGISFNVMNGSGEYTFITPSADLYGTALGTGITDGMVSGSGQANINGEGMTVEVIVVDAINETCRSTPVSMFVPICPDPCPSASEVFINEFHYDNGGTDVNEFVEVAVADTYEGALSDLSVVLYNGGSTYDTKTLDQFTAGSNSGGFTYYSFTYPVNGIQNGGSDGLALACGGQAIQFLSYEGTITAANGPAQGMTSTDVGVSEGGGQVEAGSIEFIDGVWLVVCQNTKGAENEGITECCDIEIVSVNTTTACPDQGGTITINASCTSCDGIQYSINGGASFQSSNMFPNQPAGMYQVVVQDAADSECEDMVTATVSGPDGTLPAPWMGTDVGSTGTAGNAYSFDECSGEFTAAGGGNNAFPGTNTDAVAFINQTLCGDVTITAKLESVTPNGYGGLMIRETNTANAKQVAVFSNLQSVVRHEVRYTTGGNKIVNAHNRPLPFWLRLQRQGNWVFAYFSTDGMNFQYIHAVNVPMSSCVQVGMASFTYFPGQQCTAVFSNVNVSGGITPFAQTPEQGVEFETAQAKATSVFPNPATSQLNIDFGSARELPTTLRVRNELGQIVEQRRLETPAIRTTLDVSGLANGMYFIELLTEGAEAEVLRFIKTR